MQGDAGKPDKAKGQEAEGGPKPSEPGKPAGGTDKGSKVGGAASGDSANPPVSRRTLRFGIIALALIVGVIAWLATRGGDDESTSASSNGTEAKIVDLGELEEFAAASGHSVYWAGPRPGKEIEASEGANGDVQIRYLDEGTEAGGGSPGVLTVGSYPLPDPAAAVEGFAGRKGSLVRHSPSGREVVTSAEKPTSVYFAGSEGDVQVEVYDPSYKRAMSLALSEQVQPVG